MFKVLNGKAFQTDSNLFRHFRITVKYLDKSDFFLIRADGARASRLNNYGSCLKFWTGSGFLHKEGRDGGIGKKK